MRIGAATVRHGAGTGARRATGAGRAEQQTLTHAAAGLPPARIAGVPATSPRCGSPADYLMGPVRRRAADETTTGAAGFSAAPVSSSTHASRRNAAPSTILLMVRELSARAVSRRHYRACNNSTCPAEHRHNNSNRPRTRRGPRPAWYSAEGAGCSSATPGLGTTLPPRKVAREALWRIVGGWGASVCKDYYTKARAMPAAAVYQDSSTHEFDTRRGAPVQSGYDG